MGGGLQPFGGSETDWSAGCPEASRPCRLCPRVYVGLWGRFVLPKALCSHSPPSWAASPEKRPCVQQNARRRSCPVRLLRLSEPLTSCEASSSLARNPSVQNQAPLCSSETAAGLCPEALPLLTRHEPAHNRCLALGAHDRFSRLHQVTSPRGPYGRPSVGVSPTRSTESSCPFESTTVLSGMGAPSSRRLANVSIRCDKVSSDGGIFSIRS